MTGKVLHLMGWDKKFVPTFISFVKNNFDKKDHQFIIYGLPGDNEIPYGENIEHHPNLLHAIWKIESKMRAAQKIILHGIFSPQPLYILTLQPSVLRKCYWVIWGGDLYTYQLGKRNFIWWRVEIFRRFTIKRLGHLITHIKGDYKLAQHWYEAKGQWHECFMYPSNLYHESPTQSLQHDEINILIGNSADSSNNHIEILDQLKIYAKENIRIYCPLSYGDQSHANKVSDYGALIFGDKFKAIRTFMSLDKYLELLSEIDIAIFNHKRQQGMGNTTTLLGMGKKVYIRKNVTPYPMFKELGIEVYSMDNFDLEKIKYDVAQNNQRIIKEYFSQRNLINQWSAIYE